MIDLDFDGGSADPSVPPIPLDGAVVDPLLASFTPSEIAWLDSAAHAQGSEVEDLIVSLVREIIRDEQSV